MYRFNGFTEKANRALNLGIEQAQDLGHTYIGSEHILLGILLEGSGTACALLNGAGVTAESVTELLTERVGRGNRTHLTPSDFTPRAKRILEISIAAARSMNSGYVGTEHVLFATVKEGQSYAVGFLEELGADPDRLAEQIQGVGSPSSSPLHHSGKKAGKNNSATPTLEKFGRDFPDVIDEVKLNYKLPLVVEVPDRHGTGRKPDFITSYVNEAIGIKL